MDLYSVLGVAKTATNDEIKKAYRKMAMQYHPDRTGGDKAGEAKFKEVNRAYEVLGDEQKRHQYDTYGSVGGNSGGFSGSGFGFEDIDLGDIFSSFFGGNSRSSNSRQAPKEKRGEDLEYFLNIDLETSIFGGKKEIKFEKLNFCESCNGEGGKGKKTCQTCAGRGKVTYRQNSLFGVIEHTGVCEDCNGSGESIEHICSKCNGKKRFKDKITLNIDIPAGIDNGMIIKMTGEGNGGINTRSSGDLYIKFGVELEDKGLKRKGNNLYFDLEIDLLEAILGTSKEIKLPILGKRTINIEAGTQFATVIKLSGDGVKDVNNDKKGDLFITLDIKIPKRLTREEKELYDNLSVLKGMGETVGNKKKGLFK